MIPWLAVTTRCFYTREPFIQEGAVAEWYKALHLYDKINEDPNFLCLPPAWAIFKKRLGDYSTVRCTDRMIKMIQNHFYFAHILFEHHSRYLSKALHHHKKAYHS